MAEQNAYRAARQPCRGIGVAVQGFDPIGKALDHGSFSRQFF
jgi:hypothetical protein